MSSNSLSDVTRKSVKLILTLMGGKIFNYANYRYLYNKADLKCPAVEWSAPRRYNQKIIWLKRNYRHPNASLHADKLRVKEFVAKKLTGSGGIIIPTLGSWASAREIDYNSLPRSFILKCNHGAGWNVLVTDKSDLDLKTLTNKLDRWLNTNYYSIGREYQYKDIPPGSSLSHC